MAAERGVRLLFGPKRGQWRIEVDEAAEKRIAKAGTEGRSSNRLGRTPSRARQMHHDYQRAVSMRALGVIQAVRSIRSTGSENSQSSSGENRVQTLAHSAPLDLVLDPERLALPRNGYTREELRDALAKIQPVDDTSASDQVF